MFFAYRKLQLVNIFNKTALLADYLHVHSLLDIVSVADVKDELQCVFSVSWSKDCLAYLYVTCKRQAAFADFSQSHKYVCIVQIKVSTASCSEAVIKFHTRTK